ncbi:MAG: long-chain fatty acid--CoA ligase [Austwickia sp.]|nr:long-chain fatty acid--CoA ligase [Austwickia sp.]
MGNLALNLTATAAAHPDRVALKMDDDEYSFAKLDDTCARFAGWLTAQGIEPGDRVALSLPNLPAFVVVYYGVLRMGGVVVPMNPLFVPREVSYYLEDSGAKLLVGLPGTPAEQGSADSGVTFLPVTDLPAVLGAANPMNEVAERDDEDTAVLLYTSGTTGRPKGAELRHGNLQSNQKTSADTLFKATPEDVVMGCLPLFHVFGMTAAMNIAIAYGCTLTMLPRFEPMKALEIIERDRATVFLGVPTMYAAMLAAKDAKQWDMGSLRLCVSGGSSMPVEVMKAFEKAFDVMILEGYGLSETSPVASFNHPDRERKPGSIGTPIAGVEMRLFPVEGGDAPVPVGEIGEIAIRGENIMRGYWNRPDATAEAIREGGWFYSGDLARQDEDGYYFIVDRSKDLIIRGGYNVYPREVEEALYEHPAIAEAAVVGVPHPTHGEEVAAYVVLKPGTQASTEEIQAFVKERVAPYKYPRIITVMGELPKGATGKILKRELRHDPE